jgi:hypothetical protein
MTRYNALPLLLDNWDQRDIDLFPIGFPNTQHLFRVEFASQFALL